MAKGQINMVVGAVMCLYGQVLHFSRVTCRKYMLEGIHYSSSCLLPVFGWQNNAYETQLTEYFKRGGNYASLKAHMRALMPPLFLLFFPVCVFIPAMS